MGYIYKITAIFALVFMMNRANSLGISVKLAFEKSSFYSVLSSNKLEDINAMLAELKQSSSPEKGAYEGTLMMKKAGLLAKAKEKLNVFKQGRAKLEAAIKTDNDNIEFRFLRLIIQENAPKIVNYKNDLQGDSKLLKSSYKKLSAAIQQVIKDYSKNSKVLSPSDF